MKLRCQFSDEIYTEIYNEISLIGEKYPKKSLGLIN